MRGIQQGAVIKSEIDKYIGARIRERRLELTMSQKSLAKAVGVSFQQIQHYETGANGITAIRLFEIARVLNVSLSFLFPVPATAAHHKP